MRNREEFVRNPLMIRVGDKAPNFTLFGVGFVKGRLAAKAPARSGAQFFAIAVGAALLGYLIGLVVQHFFPDVSIPV